MAKRLFLVLVALAVVSVGGEAKAAKIQLGDDAFVDLRLLIQPQAMFTHNDQNSSANGDWRTDFYIRRVRIILAGQVLPSVKFFVETDQPNLGLKGDWSKPIFIQDAYIDFDLDPSFKVAGGMILLPFSHNSRQSAATLDSLDYHTALVRYQADMNKVWRDAGVETRGLILNHLDYRIGVYQGLSSKSPDPYISADIKNPDDGFITDPATIVYDADGNVSKLLKGKTNPKDWPRFTGRLQLNILDPEDSFFYNGIYFGKKKIVSIGAGFDVAPDTAQDLVGTFDVPDPVDPSKPKLKIPVTKPTTYWAVVGDAFVDLPVGETMEVVGQAAYYHYDQGEDQTLSGSGGFAELGYRVSQIEPVVSWEQFDGDGTSTDKLARGDWRALRLGLNYWIKEHAANLKAEYAFISKTRSIEDAGPAITVQAQVLF